jgi:GntR family transcriptional regulator/MocR family aminotransferase
VIIVSSARAGLDLALRMLLEPGDRVWHEEPGYNGARAAILGQGLDIYPVAVDTHGLNVAQGIQHAGDARLVYVTPSHHYPTGATLALERRLELLEWARAGSAWILEDDYDSEFRYNNRPIAALQGLAVEEHVIYLGSFAKTLFPGLKIAYLVVPDGFSRSFIQAVRHTGQEPSLPLQAALCDFFEKGYFSRHIRRMRTLYAERRAALISAIDRHLGAAVTLLPSEGGLQLAILLPHGLSDKQLSAAAATRGITAQPLSDYFINTPQPQGFVLGFAATPAGLIDSALAKLAALIRA